MKPVKQRETIGSQIYVESKTKTKTSQVHRYMEQMSGWQRQEVMDEVEQVKRVQLYQPWSVTCSTLTVVNSIVHGKGA